MKLEQEYYLISEIAKLAGVSKVGAWKWVDKGKVKVYRPHPSIILVAKSEVARLMNERGILAQQ